MMGSFKARLVVMAAVVFGGLALAAAEEVGPFARVDVRLPNGSAFHAQASADSLAPQATSVVLSGDGFLITVAVPKDVSAGARVQVPTTLQAADQIQRGVLTFDVEETQPFLGGKLSGNFGPLALSGALRLRTATGVALRPVSEAE